MEGREEEVSGFNLNPKRVQYQPCEVLFGISCFTGRMTSKRRSSQGWSWQKRAGWGRFGRFNLNPLQPNKIEPIHPLALAVELAKPEERTESASQHQNSTKSKAIYPQGMRCPSQHGITARNLLWPPWTEESNAKYERVPIHGVENKYTIDESGLCRQMKWAVG